MPNGRRNSFGPLPEPPKIVSSLQVVLLASGRVQIETRLMKRSTTHTISSAIMGVGATERLSAVRWGMAGNILTAWVLTIPMSAAVAAGMYTTVHLFLP